MKIPAFAKTIRFKLTVWYAALLLIFVALFVLGLNLTMQRLAPPTRFTHLPETMRIVIQVQSDNIQLVRNYSLAGLGGLVLLGAGGGYFLSRRLLQPVDRVSSKAAGISSTSLHQRINYSGPDDEIKRLADTFDGMLERLENAFEAQKRFIQDASHELKTPIAIALTNIEVTEMDEEVTTKEYQRLMEVLKMSLWRLKKLSDDLLLLSEAGLDRSKWSTVNMASLLREVQREAGGKARAAGVNLELDLAPDETCVFGDALYLNQAVINLVDNAIKYSNPNGTVRIASRQGDGQVVIEVENRGIGISQADQPRIFDRFYRVDRSRSRAQGGYGLGLAIVKKIVEDHGGTVSVTSALDEGSTFRISLPRHGQS